MDGLAEQVEELGRTRFRDSYSGLVLEGDRLVVYRRDPAPGLDQAVRSLAGERGVELRDAAHSATELEALRTRLERDLDDWRRRGVDITTVGTAADGSAVQVGAVDPQVARRELAGRYGASAPLRVERVGPVTPLPR